MSMEAATPSKFRWNCDDDDDVEDVVNKISQNEQMSHANSQMK